MFESKKILIGITGSIAAYKVCDLIRMFIKAGAEVKTVLTPSALQFVTKTTLATLTKNPVYIEQFDVEDWKPEHIELCDWADVFVIAPASANTISKLANGLCDNLLTSVACAYQKQLILAPAMNEGMWKNPAVQKNLETLKNRGMKVIEPSTGELACGIEGKGRLADIEDIFSFVYSHFSFKQFLKGKNILITAGGTKEEIDPVRYLGNHSSGKMGIAFADAAYEAGAEVVLISTVEAEKPYKTIKTVSAIDMHKAVNENFVEADILIMAAAVADYRPLKRCEQKIKKNEDSLTIEMVKNPDILKEMAFKKRNSQVIVGFSAESENLFENAIKKLENKNLDFIVANDISGSETGFNSEYNEVLIIDKNKNVKTSGKQTKREIARIIIEEIANGFINTNNIENREFCSSRASE